MKPDGHSAVRTSVGSSKKVYVSTSNSSPALSILFANCPIIHMMDAFDSGSSSASMCSHSFGIIPSYLPGYRRKMSLITMMASWTTYETPVSMSPSRLRMQASAPASTLIARRPIERTALRTKSMSTSDAYL
jgi:hypothetical protein